jgi:hypothetical protein
MGARARTKLVSKTTLSFGRGAVRGGTNINKKFEQLRGCAAILFLGGSVLAGCAGEDDVSTGAPSAMKLESTEAGGSPLAMVEPSGPKLAPLALGTPVYDKPEKGTKVIGYLRLGAKVARSKEPVSKRDCAEGWYALYPSGFVCAGASVTLDMQHPLVRAISVEPNRAMPMPYKYAFVRAIAPNYLRVPTTSEQFQYEMRLERHLRSWKKLTEEWDALDVGANDVPLDANGLALGAIPDHARPLGISERFGGDGNDTIPWWLAETRKIPNVTTFKAPAYAVISGRVRRHAGVALIGSFVTGEESQGRRFAITTDARLLPADKLKADSGSPFHGGDISSVGLPVAFVRKAGSRWLRYADGKLEKGDAVAGREFIPLTGNVRLYGGARIVETRDGRWLKSEDLKTIAKPSELPAFARGDQRWIDVSILNQTLVLWQGNKPTYATLVSTGRDGLGDPRTTLSTPQGTFRIYQKHVTTTMDSDVADKEFELRDVPWVMYFKAGYALHAAYWHDDFGRERSHGCINLSPIDARYVFAWTTPEVPEHWHAVNEGNAFGKGTLVNVGP